MATRERAGIGRDLWVRWVLANVIGFAVGGAIAGTIARAIGQPQYGVLRSTEAVFIATRIAGAALAVWGAAIGTAQWLVIRRELRALLVDTGDQCGMGVGRNRRWHPQRIDGRGGNGDRPRCRGMGLRRRGRCRHCGPWLSAGHIPVDDPAATG